MEFLEIGKSIINLANVTVISRPEDDLQTFRHEIFFEFCNSVYGHVVEFKTREERDVCLKKLKKSLGLENDQHG